MNTKSYIELLKGEETRLGILEPCRLNSRETGKINWGTMNDVRLAEREGGLPVFSQETFYTKLY